MNTQLMFLAGSRKQLKAPKSRSQVHQFNFRDGVGLALDDALKVPRLTRLEPVRDAPMDLVQRGIDARRRDILSFDARFGKQGMVLRPRLRIDGEQKQSCSFPVEPVYGTECRQSQHSLKSHEQRPFEMVSGGSHGHTVRFVHNDDLVVTIDHITGSSGGSVPMEPPCGKTQLFHDGTMNALRRQCRHST